MPTETALNRQDFYHKMDNLLNVAPGSVQGSQELSSLQSWDSLTILEFIVLADSDYRSDVQASDIAGCKTVDELADLTFANAS